MLPIDVFIVVKASFYEFNYMYFGPRILNKLSFFKNYAYLSLKKHFLRSKKFQILLEYINLFLTKSINAIGKIYFE
jgi:hypothetical protein